MEIRRFGAGHRRPDGPAGTHGVEGQPIHADRRGVVAELALRRNARIAPHENPNLTYFLVIEGGGFVQVGEEKARVSAGDAVVWPPNVTHSAWTELTPMRAIVVEFAEKPEGPALLLEGNAGSGGAAEVSPAEGSPAPGRSVPPDRVSPEREPW
jgi:quercetin dioxygenase-like cupin family protein